MSRPTIPGRRPSAPFRSLWGLPSTDWTTEFEKLSDKFDGVEASLSDIGYPNTDRFFSALNAAKLNWICGIYTGWDDYEKGRWKKSSVEEVGSKVH
jgi:hypothetical protein